MNFTIIISAVSLIVSIISFMFSIHSQCLQNKVNEIELRLKEHELIDKQKEAYVQARIIRETNSKYRIKVWNSGNSIAKNVMVSWDKSDGLQCWDLEKMPFEELEPQKNFELTLSTYFGAPSKLQIKTEWKNEKSETREKYQWCDL